jgi:hypothetical protein
MFPIASRFYPVLFAQGSTKGKHDKANFYFQEGGKFLLLCRGMPNVPKLLMMGQSNGSFFFKQN